MPRPIVTEEAALKTLVRKLRRLAPIDTEDERQILSLSARAHRHDARRYLVREGSVPTECSLLVDGYAARSKVSADGGRQILSFHFAGDLLDIQHLFLESADHDVQTITDANVVWIPMVELRSLVALRPNIATALVRDILIDASIFREWILNLGRRDAKTRIAHMLCEFITRSMAAGMGTPQRLELPFTQEEIGDATGLTPVHVNRMLKTLTEEGLIRRENRRLVVPDWPCFQRVAGFNEAYLHAAA